MTLPVCLTRTTIAAAIVALALAGCVSSQPPAARVKPGTAVTLRLAIYGDSGYEQSGLLRDYERLHPGTRIVTDDAASEASYSAHLLRTLAANGSLDDLVAIPFTAMPQVIARYAGQLVPLDTLGSAADAIATFQDTEAPWMWRAATLSGHDYGIGAEAGPLALCYRPALLKEAGMPSTTTRLTRAWSTWQGYLASGRLFASRIPSGPAFMDSVTSLYNAMVSQARTQYYTPRGKLAIATSPAVRQAWLSAVGAAADHLSARLVPMTRAWDTAVVRWSFATAICPAWMLSLIAHVAGPGGSGAWAVIPVPGGGGDSGGFYLAVPRASAHQQDAYQLALYLTGQQAGQVLTQAGVFPARTPAITAAVNVTNPYFSDARVGLIYGQAAGRVPDAPAGPEVQAIGADVDAALAAVQSGKPAAKAWAQALRQVAAVARAHGA